MHEDVHSSTPNPIFIIENFKAVVEGTVTSMLKITAFG
jgi:hypothetical protein